MDIKRKDNEPPLAIENWGWRYHHIGIPTKESINDEKYFPKFKFFFGGFESSPFGAEWMRFEDDSPINELIKSVPHIAFEVDDLDSELEKHSLNILTKPNSPGEGIRVAMIEHNGVPIELIEFSKS